MLYIITSRVLKVEEWVEREGYRLISLYWKWKDMIVVGASRHIFHLKGGYKRESSIWSVDPSLPSLAATGQYCEGQNWLDSSIWMGRQERVIEKKEE